VQDPPAQVTTHANPSEQIMLVDRPLNGLPQEGPDDVNDYLFSTTMDPDAARAEAFLKTHPMAKIIFIVDTHCLENGYLVWTGDRPETYQGCTLLEVRLLRYIASRLTRPHPFHRS